MATELETLTGDLAARIDRLPRRSAVALYWACSSGLFAAYQEWAVVAEARTEPILCAALAEGYRFALWGREIPHDGPELLQALEDLAPPGELLGHEEPHYWASQVYYRGDTRWWKEDAQLIPRGYP
jgi:hypothetical protein